MTTTTQEVLQPESVLAAAREALRKMPDPLDLPASWTRRQIDEHEVRRSMLTNHAQRIATEMDNLAERDRQLRPLQEWYELLLEWRTTLAEELAALPSPTTPREHGVFQNYALSLRAIDDVFTDGTAGYALQTLRLGALMAEAGFVPDAPVEGQAIGHLAWHGSLPSTEYRIADLSKRRAEIQSHLDAAVKAVADALDQL